MMHSAVTLRACLAGAVFLMAAALPSAAVASEGYPVTDVNLRTGPDTAYPIIDTIPAGDLVEIIGCLSDWSWCDVAWDGIRGWVAGDYLETLYESRRVYLPDYVTLIALPVIAFEFNVYWDAYYRDRPWYRHRDRWYSYWRHHPHHAERREHRREVERHRDRDRSADRDRDRQRARQDNAQDQKQLRERRRDRDTDARGDNQRDRKHLRENRRKDGARGDNQRARQHKATVRQDQQRARKQIRKSKRLRDSVIRHDRQRVRQHVRENRQQQRQQVIRKQKRGGGECRPRANGKCP